MGSRRNLLSLISAGAVCALLFAGCGSKENEPAAPVAAVDPSTVGSISGRVTLTGTPPAFKPIDMSASPACVQANQSPVVPPLVVTGKNGALANVVVYVKDGLGNYRFDAPKDPVILSQKNCMYEPHVVALMTHQRFEIENNDPTMHNVHPMPEHNRQWSTSQPVGSAALKSTFARTEFAMPILCNVHPWMRAFGFVFSNPYFAVTSETGKFEIGNLPPGTYTIEAWQETYGTQDQAVTIGPKESKVIAFTFAAAAAGR
jgi:Carboxypeptidase regulatory-like domain